jgi:hypothetical protein
VKNQSGVEQMEKDIDRSLSVSLIFVRYQPNLPYLLLSRLDWLNELAFQRMLRYNHFLLTLLAVRHPVHTQKIELSSLYSFTLRATESPKISPNL